MKNLLLFIPISILAIACTKPAGKGGSSSISGTVYHQLYDHNNKLIDTQLALAEKVYITYGESGKSDDDIDSYADGSFIFEYLRKGDYKVFAYQECDTCDSESSIVSYSATVDNDDHVAEVKLYLRNNVGVESGNSMISGTLMSQDYSGGIPVGSPYIATDTKVYIVYDSDEVYFERMDTDFEGKYAFTKLIKGTYTIYAENQCNGCSSLQGISQIEVTIDQNGNQIVAPALTFQNYP